MLATHSFKQMCTNLTKKNKHLEESLVDALKYPGTQVLPRYPGTKDPGAPRYPGAWVPYLGTRVSKYPGTQGPGYLGTQLSKDSQCLVLLKAERIRRAFAQGVSDHQHLFQHDFQ